MKKLLIAAVIAIPFAAAGLSVAADGSKLGNSVSFKAKMAKHDALISAAERNDHAALRALLASGANPDHVIAGDGTALIIAARHGNMKAVKMLVEAGADIDLASSGDGAPLLAAAGYGQKGVVDYLLAQGADVEQSSPGDGNALIKAALSNHVEIARTLIAAGAKVDTIVPSDETALINAAQAGHLEMVKFLVDEAGADISLGVIANPEYRPQWRSPLSEARRMKHKDVADWLEMKGAVERRL